MAESTLALNWYDLMNEVGFYLGYGRESHLSSSSGGVPTIDLTSLSTWTTDQGYEIERAVAAGLRQFYCPPIMPGKAQPHEWTFLKPRTSIPVWTDDEVTLSLSTATCSGGAYVPPPPITGRTTVTSDTAEFTADMVGEYLCITDVGPYEIASYTSPTVVVVIGNASAASGATYSVGPIPVEILGVTNEPYHRVLTIFETAAFVPSMVGATITITGSEAGSYTITEYVSDHELKVYTAVGTSHYLAYHMPYSITSAGAYRMPDVFGGILGDMYFDVGDGRYTPISIVNEGQVRHKLQASDSTGRPYCAAIRPVALATSTTTGQRFDLIVFPIPDTDYTLHYRYTVLPDALFADGLYPWGGATHAETIKASCLAAAAKTNFPVEKEEKWTEYLRLLQVSIGVDQQLNTAETLGYCGDPSARGAKPADCRLADGHVVTVYGTAYP